MGADPPVSFLVSPRTGVCRPIVMVLYEARQASRIVLTTTQIATELERRFDPFGCADPQLTTTAFTACGAN